MSRMATAMDQMAEQPFGVGSPNGLPRIFLTVDEVAAMLGCSRDTVTRLISAGQLPAKDLGIGKHHNFRIKASDLNDHLNAKPRKADAHPMPTRRGRRNTRRSAYKPQILTP